MLGSVIKIVQMTKISHGEPCEYAFLQSMGYARRKAIWELCRSLSLEIGQSINFFRC